MDMNMKFDKLVSQKYYRSSKLYHGTMVSGARNIEINGIRLKCGRLKADFNPSGGNGSFYVTADHIQAVKRAKLKSGKHSHAGRGKNKTSKKKRSAPKGPFSPAIVKFKIDRQELYQEFKCKRFKTGQYADWANFIQLSRNCQNYHDYDIVEGPFDSTAGKGSLRKPKGHQLGIFSQAAKEYFDDHCISIPHQLPAETVNSLPISMQSITIS